jgi:hypothetical protein
MEKNCIQCNKLFKKKPTDSLKTWNNRTKLCSRECRIKYTAKKQIGNKYTLGISPVNKGKKLSGDERNLISIKTREAMKRPEIAVKLGKANLGKKYSEQRRLEISKRIKEEYKNGRTPTWLGKKGEMSANWQGGKSFEPYSVDWSKTLKRSIRERDKYTCQICYKPQGDIALCVHHIDYDKKNCDPKNLVTLCISCHTKTNGNREFWKNFFSPLA